MIDPLTISASIAAFTALAKLVSSFDDEALTAEQLAAKRAAELASRSTFDTYVANLPPKG